MAKLKLNLSDTVDLYKDGVCLVRGMRVSVLAEDKENIRIGLDGHPDLVREPGSKIPLSEGFSHGNESK